MGIPIPREEEFDQESYDGEADELEEDLLEEKQEVKAKQVNKPQMKKPVVKQVQQAPAQEEKIKDRYEAFHQRENIGIVDTVTGEIIGSFGDEGTAAAMALMLNKQDKVITSAGYE